MKSFIYQYTYIETHIQSHSYTNTHIQRCGWSFIYQYTYIESLQLYILICIARGRVALRQVTFTRIGLFSYVSYVHTLYTLYISLYMQTFDSILITLYIYRGLELRQQDSHICLRLYSYLPYVFTLIHVSLHICHMCTGLFFWYF